MTESIERWGLYELSATGPTDGNPFTDVHFRAEFRYEHRAIEVDGFYDGNGVYRVRFMPDMLGEWHCRTISNVAALDGQTGSFNCVEPSAGNHGPVRVRDTFHFAYADGTPYRQVGTTAYAWAHQGDEREQQTLNTLKNAPFNKMRMCVFPKHYRYNANEPDFYPFESAGDSLTEWDFTRYNPAHFQHFERLVGQLSEIGVEADIILLHPYDRWDFSKMPAADVLPYLRYVVARLAAYRNVWWSLANEYDLMLRQYPMNDWDVFLQTVQVADPYQHMRGVHNWQRLETHDHATFYDHTKPWITHCSVQHSHMNLVETWRNQYKKPIVVDELCYEGDIQEGWGNISARELVHRFWECTVYGGYAGHGECYRHPDDVLWWAKGGELHGESPARLAFLRDILEAAPDLDPLRGVAIHNMLPFAGQAGEYYLGYTKTHQPGELILHLPEDVAFTIDIIDGWEMTITRVDGTRNGTFTLPLPGKPYQAIRIQRTE